MDPKLTYAIRNVQVSLDGGRDMCECCGKKPAILNVAVWYGRYDQDYFDLCADCLKIRFSFTYQYQKTRFN